MLNYTSTRGNTEIKTAAQAIIQGIAKDKGLFVPVEIPTLEKSMDLFKTMTYQEVAYEVLSSFLTDFTKEELDKAIKGAYDEKFEKEEIVPIKKEAGVFFLELYHGKTAAFKDMALSILPYLLTIAIKKEKVEKTVVILTATSGDTGKAALEGFADVENTKIIVFFPDEGVSEIQRRQMVTQEGDNTYVVAIKGNFDDAQSGVKEIFNDDAFNKELEAHHYAFSSANSINIGRLVPQVAYYVYAYAQLLKDKEIENGEAINVVVPTGNFGNILSAYYAKKMGVPIKKFICASNKNNVLTDFINTGIYDIRRSFHVTNSPSMDILISSNLERFLYEISGGDTVLVKNLMEQLSENKQYEIPDALKAEMDMFYGGFTDEETTIEVIRKIYEENDYLMDTHTAVGYSVYENYIKETNDETKTIIASTASPYKFTKSVMEAVDPEEKSDDEFELLNALNKCTSVNIPKELKDLDKKQIYHDDVIEKEAMKEIIRKKLW